MLNLNVPRASTSRAMIGLTIHWQALQVATVIVFAAVAAIAGLLGAAPSPVLIAPQGGPGGGGG